ncbi:type I-C CRISPR-associated protein Cas8c/Csd1 [Metasolibacillus sp. FSL K6-0083]|uniref:type I-C CRISPR-associated protein Cas8c/Csd1 n=1 Tax=Metasolibacillus sp. FSL K6-0083 TaxID=2921416 RepID=UPI00315B1AA4
MSYLQALYRTYDENLDEVGKAQRKEFRNGQSTEYMLLPISHTTQTAHIEVLVDLEGNFYDAYELDKENTVLPFTEESGSRSGQNYVPHFLHDKLMFVAGDYKKFVEADEKKAAAYDAYITQLAGWCTSSYSHPYIEAIYHYVKKGTVIEDLVREGVLHTDSQDLLMKKWTGEQSERPKIFSVIASEQEAAFVRFNVHIPGEVVTPIWRNQEIFSLFIHYYNTLLKEKDLCYVTGEQIPRIERHPNKLRNSGDKAKLISANDAAGFTYRGRFTSSLEAANISYDASQKAHNALKWLIEKQGKTIDGRVFLVWGTAQLDIPVMSDDLFEQEIDWTKDFDLFEAVENKDILKTQLAKQYGALLAGLSRNIQLEESKGEKVYILTIDAATPGRLAVLYYREYDIQLYFDRLADWHTKASWRQTRKKDNEWIHFYGAPSFYTIAHAAYGPRPSDKVVKGVMERLIPCVLDDRKIPIDIVRSAIVRASNPQFYSESWEWEQALTVACSLTRKTYEQEGFTVALDTNCKDRDYLFGRMLAVADVLERRALGKEENRATNALRYLSAFQANPLRTWLTIQKNLQPYQMKLRDKANYYTSLIDKIASEIPIEQFNDTALSGRYLLGYYSQRQDLYTKKDKEGEMTE